jgi:hypothetical protein
VNVEGDLSFYLTGHRCPIYTFVVDKVFCCDYLSHKIYPNLKSTLAFMPALSNPRWEKFCHLVVAGKTYTEAYHTLYPNTTAPAQSGYNLYHKKEIQERCQEFREEVALRAVMDLSRKREVLRQMAEGMIPTKVFNKDTGETYDALAALLADAKIAGEFAPEKLQIHSASDLKLLFNVPHRDVIDADVVEVKVTQEALGEGESKEEPIETSASGEDSEKRDSAPPTETIAENA